MSVINTLVYEIFLKNFKGKRKKKKKANEVSDNFLYFS